MPVNTSEYAEKAPGKGKREVMLPDEPLFSQWTTCSREEIQRWVLSWPEATVLGWPYNGTRRWYMLRRREGLIREGYLRTLVRRQAEHHRLVFEHGVQVILAPSFGNETLKRGAEYTRAALKGLTLLAEDDLYQAMVASGVRIGFYGDYRGVLDTTEYRPVLQILDDLAERSAGGGGPLLLFGLFADDPHPELARLSVEFARRTGYPPSREQLIEEYYGHQVPDLSLYIGFERPEMFDVPLVATGLENLYFTLNPSPDLSETQLREILYDHFVTRRQPLPDYESLGEEALQQLAHQHEAHRETTVGTGELDRQSGLWRPRLHVPGLRGPKGDTL